MKLPTPRRPGTSRWILLALTLSLVVAPASASESAEATPEIIARAVAALGGADAWRAVEGVKMTGEFTTFSSTRPFELLRQRPNLYRFDHYDSDKRVIVGFDGERAWWQNEWIPFAEVPWPTAPPVAYSQGFAADAEFVYPFLDAAERGHQLEDHGPSSFDGTSTHEVRIRLASGGEEVWHFDPQTALPTVRVSNAGYTGLQVQQVMYFMDFQPVEGLQFPFRIESDLGNQVRLLEVESVELDPVLGGGEFDKPLAPPVRWLTTLEGQWQVEMTTRQMPTLPWVPSPGISTFRVVDGEFVEERLEFHFYGRPRVVTRLYSWDKFRQRFAVVHIDTLTAHPILLVGTADPAAGPVAFDNLETGTEWSMGPMPPVHNRLTLDGVGPTGFSSEWQVSLDGGASWSATIQATYRRAGDAGAQPAPGPQPQAPTP